MIRRPRARRSSLFALRSSSLFVARRRRRSVSSPASPPSPSRPQRAAEQDAVLVVRRDHAPPEIDLLRLLLPVEEVAVEGRRVAVVRVRARDLPRLLRRDAEGRFIRANVGVELKGNAPKILRRLRYLLDVAVVERCRERRRRRRRLLCRLFPETHRRRVVVIEELRRHGRDLALLDDVERVPAQEWRLARVPSRPRDIRLHRAAREERPRRTRAAVYFPLDQTDDGVALRRGGRGSKLPRDRTRLLSRGRGRSPVRGRARVRPVKTRAAARVLAAARPIDPPAADAALARLLR
eukprot:30864-Pelagococcus_subviridis.AAC.3